MSDSTTDTNPQHPISAAWDWSLRRSPILNTWRWINYNLHPQRRAADRLAAANLPDPITACIHDMVRRTRLRSLERDEVCRELIAHSTDALGTISEPERVSEALGDPKAAATLIRRAMKRKRSRLYHARVYLTRASLGCFAILFLIYAALFIRFNSGSPTIKTDYLAQLNAPILATSQEDRAIDVYQSVYTDWRLVYSELAKVPPVEIIDDRGDINPSKLIQNLPNINKPTHPHYPQIREAVLTFRPTLDQLHESSSRQIMGYVYTDKYPSADGTQPAEPTHPLADGALLGVLLPHLGQLRKLSLLLAADARLAEADGDAQRVTDHLTTIANTARLLADDPFLISDLAAIAIHNFAASEINRVLANNPDLLTADQLLTLSHTLAASGEKVNTTDLRGESYFFEDFLQRVFTDNGQGDGRLTPEGLSFLTNYQNSWNEDSSSIPNLAGPVTMEFIASRAQLSALHRQHLDAARSTLARGPESLPELHTLADELENLNPIEAARIFPVSMILPALTRSVDSVFKSQTHTDATLIVLAAQQYRREHGEYPATLDQLVPQYLPSLPPDLFDPGQPMKYRLTDTGFMVYVNGADGDDDNGTPFQSDGQRITSRNPIWVQDFDMRYPRPNYEYPEIPDADWILFPPQD